MPRLTSQPAFWDERYALGGLAFGAEPDPFLAEALAALEAEHGLAVPSRVVDLGAGEGRHAVYAAQRGHRAVAVDFAAAGLREAEALAARRGVEIETVEADLAAWEPAARYDVALMGLVHLLPEPRRRLLARMPEVLRPGGWLLARWFRPAHARRRTFGPSAEDRLVEAGDVRAALPGGVLHRCEARTVSLASGRYLHGPADVLDVVWQAPPPDA